MNGFIYLCATMFFFAAFSVNALAQESVGASETTVTQQGAPDSDALTNHIWSVAGSDDRMDVNSTFIQPFLAYNTRDAWTYTVNSEMSYDWSGNQWSIPVHFTVSKLVRFGRHPVSFGGALRCWATVRQEVRRTAAFVLL